MDEGSRHFLLGIGLIGAVFGASLGVVAGEAYRDCADVYALAGAEGAAFTAGGVHALCETLAAVRVAGMGLVALSGLVATLPVAARMMDRRREASDP